jgi:WD40 repeat protein
MHAERDHLVRFVFPELEQRCRHRGAEFVAVDLRWGVTQQEAENGEAINICLEEIKNCRPFFVCLLGERYGWLPLPTVVAKAAIDRLDANSRALFFDAYYENPGFDEYLLRPDAAREERWGAHHEEKANQLLTALEALGLPDVGMSITAQEINRGVLDDPEQMTHSVFYFRAPELTEALAAKSDNPADFREPSEVGQRKLATLKEHIVDAGLALTPYDDLEHLGNTVRDQLWERIDAELPKEATRATDPFEEERRAQELFVQRLTRFFVGREAQLSDLADLTNRCAGYIAVTGASGAGKTALLANWLHGNDHYTGYHERNPDRFVISHFIGASPRSANVRDTLERFCKALAPVAEWEDDVTGDVEKLRETLPQILAAAAQRRPIFILIDALDQLEQTDDAITLDWLPAELPENVTLLASSLSREQDQTWPVLRARAGDCVMDVPSMAQSDIEELIRKYLAVYRKQLDDRQLPILLGKNDAGSPLYLQVALDELRSFGEYERLTEYLHELPNTIPAMYEFVLDHLEAEHGEAFVRSVMSCLACGRYGMTESELLALGEPEGGAVTPLKWARLSRILDSHLISRGNTLTFYHRQLREAVERQYLPGDHERQAIHRFIAAYFQQQPLMNGRKFEEQAWQETEGGMLNEVKDTLTDFDFLEAKCLAGMVHDLLDDYGHAISQIDGAQTPALDQRPSALTDIDDQQSEAMRLLQGAVDMSSSVLSQRPEELRSQLLGRLMDTENEALRSVMSSTASVSARPWLRPQAPSLTLPGGPLLRTLEGHTGRVSALAITPDGGRAISGSWDKTLRVWDLNSGRTLRTLKGHTHRVTAVTITPDGRRAVSGSGNETLRVWDLETGTTLHTLVVRTGFVQALAITPDSRRAVSALRDNTLHVWDLETGTTLCMLEGHTGFILAVAITPDGCRAVSASRDHTLRVWDFETGTTLHTLEGHTGPVSALAITPDGHHAVSGSDDKRLRVWDLESGRTLRTLKGHAQRVTAVAITPDGRRAVSASDDKTLRVWDLESGRMLRTLEAREAPASSFLVAITPDGRYAVSGSNDKTLRVWELESGRTLRTLEGHWNWVELVAIAPDGRRAVSASGDLNHHTLRVWDLESRRTLRMFDGHTAAVYAVAITPDDRCAVSASGDNTLRVWDLGSGRTLRTLEGHKGFVKAVAITPDGHRAVSGSDDTTLRVWDLNSGRTLRTLEGHTGSVKAVVITPDGHRAVSGSDDTTLRVWDLRSGRILHTLEGHWNWVELVAITPNGRHAVSGSEGETLLRVWDLESGRALRTLKAAASGSLVAITPDCRHAVSASRDHTLCVWDLESRRTLCTLEGHTDLARAAIMPDGRRAVSGSEDETLRVWNLETCRTLAIFSTDSGIRALGIGNDGLTIVAGDWTGRVHILRLEGL